MWPSPGGSAWPSSPSSASQSSIWDQPSFCSVLASCWRIVILISGLRSAGEWAPCSWLTLPRDNNAAKRWTGRSPCLPAGRAPIALGCGLAGRCDEPVQNMWACRQRAPGVFLRRLPPSRMSLPFKKRPGAPSLLGFSLFHVPNAKLQLDKATINIRFIRNFCCAACG